MINNWGKIIWIWIIDKPLNKQISHNFMHIISPSLVQSAEDKKAVTEVVGHITGTITDATYPSDDNQSSGGQFSHITLLLQRYDGKSWGSSSDFGGFARQLVLLIRLA